MKVAGRGHPLTTNEHGRKFLGYGTTLVVLLSCRVHYLEARRWNGFEIDGRSPAGVSSFELHTYLLAKERSVTGVGAVDTHRSVHPCETLMRFGREV